MLGTVKPERPVMLELRPNCECRDIELPLGIEYAPAPPFDCGRPDTAPTAVRESVTARLQRFRPDRHAAVQRAAARL